ncbi:MFS transporter [Peribacillus loiseleuriae]|uniref:MFS transporter n=1 Tax=Peribacillus loiseleuriae TaxID=1679170 RepID=A0A0K9GTN4_9BACI|nr:MFS transporter [Peribacillus loiseleuriae]KMY50015.1 MFS transporter [Peribacillus loiseleuriae]
MKLLLKNKNFLHLFLGRIVTNMGDSLYYVASMWLVYELGKSSFYTGLAGFLILLPKAMQFLSGPFVDRWSIKKTLVITQILQSVLILIIPISYLFGFLSIQLILIVMPIIAFIEEFAYPTQTKALPLILSKSELIEGNSLFSFAYQGVDLIFNALAGILVVAVGAISLYVVDSITFAMAAIFFSLLKVTQNTDQSSKEEKHRKLSIKAYLKNLTEGFSIVFNSLLWVFLVGSSIANFCIGMTMAILPSFSDTLGGVEMYGVLLTTLSAGSLIGALLGSLLGKYRVGILSIVCFTLGACCWTSAALVSSPILSTLFFGLAWIPIGAVNVLIAGVSQSVIPNRVLGRVNSVMYSLSVIVMPIGSLLGGYLATIVNSKIIFAFTGVGVLCIAIVWLVHPALRALPKAEEMSAKTFRLNFEEQNICS